MIASPSQNLDTKDVEEQWKMWHVLSGSWVHDHWVAAASENCPEITVAQLLTASHCRAPSDKKYHVRKSPKLPILPFKIKRQFISIFRTSMTLSNQCACIICKVKNCLRKKPEVALFLKSPTGCVLSFQSAIHASTSQAAFALLRSGV